MKKIFIVLSFFMIITFTIFNNSKASAAITDYGTNMTYKTLNLYDIGNPDFEFTGDIRNYTNTFAFEYRPVEESLEELIRAWADSAYFFMNFHTNVITLQFLWTTSQIPTNDIGWAQEDGYIYIIVDKDYLRDSFPIYFDDPELSTEQATLLAMADLAEAIKVDTWVITESTPDYQMGYNAGYSIGYSNGHEAGFSNGWHAKEEQINLELPILLADEYQRGHSDGYDEGVLVSQGEAYDLGYTAGANESFIATMDKWLVPAIIIVMLLGGYFAIARKKHDGDI